MASEMDIEDGQARNQNAVDVRHGKTRNKKCAKCGRIFLVLLFLAMIGCIIGLAVVLTLQKQNKSPEVITTTPAPPTDDREEAPTSATGLYRFGAVASDNEQCSRVGTEILAKYRGSSMDAAIATLFCLGVVHFPSTGIGGGFLMTIHDKNKNEVTTLTGREVAPLFATEDMYVNKSGLSTEGGLAIAVPGQIAGYAEAHKRYGTLPWSKLVEPAIRMSEEGFIVNEFLQYVARIKKDSIMKYPKLRNLLTKSDGSLVKEGDTIKRPTYAKTLRRIAEEGPNTFYNGSVAEDVVRDIQDEGGNITLEDLRNYTPLWKKPVEVTLSNGGYKLYGPPPPSSAVVMYYILNIMNGYNVSSSDTKTFKSRVLLTHRLVEAMKFGFGKRSYLGDEDFINVTEWMERLTSNSYAEETRLKINDDKVLKFEDYESAFQLANDNGTIHLSVYGPDGISVSVTSTINTYLGSKVVGNRTGIIFNNEMDDFSTPGTVNYYNVRASPSNYILPGKHPMSSTSPTIVLDKDDNMILVIGSSGGTRIISGTLQVILNTLWLGYNVTEALDQPHYHHQLLPDEILHEISWPLDIRSALKLKGNKFKIKDYNFCVTQVIKNECEMTSSGVKDGRCIQAASDLRRKGVPDGY